jgi:Helix-turn-helix domain
VRPRPRCLASFSLVHLTPAEHTEAARLFRVKLASLRADERSQPRKLRRSPLRTFRIPDQPPADDEMLTSDEVAASLGVSPQTVRSWDLPYRRTLGGHRRYRWAEVQAWVSRRASLTQRDV